jgi:hypothetical protein
MRGIINNIINFYEIQAIALSVLVANTQKALEQSEKERKANEQIQRVENLVKDLNNMLTRFYFLKERKNRKQEQMTDSQVKAMTGFAIFVKTLTDNVRSLLRRFQHGLTFEERVDEEIRELEASVRRRLKEFDVALDETSGTLTIRLSNFARDIAGSFTKLIKVQEIFLRVANSRKSYSPLGESPQNTKEDSLARPQDSGDNQLENLFNYSSIKPVESDEKRSKRLMQLKA